MSLYTDFFPAGGGGGGGGTISWQSTPKTSNFSAVNGEGYFVDTTVAFVTVTLPSSPSAGDLVSFIDYGGDAAAKPIVFTTSDNIEGGSADRAIQYDNGAINLIFSGATKGWLSAAASASAALSVPITSVDVHFLVVAGGGGSSNPSQAFYRGGGGAGGLRTSTGATYSGRGSALESALVLNLAQNYTITVGAGGAQASGYYNNNQGDGGISTFAGVTSDGGGGGAGETTSKDGGCGGGAWGNGGNYAGGIGTTAQGYDGGASNTLGNGAGGGGGGTQSVGIASVGKAGGAGGNGTSNDIDGTSAYYAAGGGGVTGYPGGGSGANGTGWDASRANNGHGGSDGTGAGSSGIIIIKFIATFTATFSAGVVQNTSQISWNGALYNVSIITGGAADTVSFAYTG